MQNTNLSAWKPSKGSRPARLNCGALGWVTVREVAKHTGLTRAGVHQRLRRMREAGEFDAKHLLAPKSASAVHCGPLGWITVKEIAELTGLTENGVHQRLSSMRKAGKFDVDRLLAPKLTPPRAELQPESNDLSSAYFEGVAAYPDTHCPYEPCSLPQSRSDRSQSPMAMWAAWWAGWNDTDRGLSG